MARQSKSTKQALKRYAAEFKEEALALAKKVGVAEAAAQLKLQSSQLYAWRVKAETVARRTETEQALVVENARLKRQLAEKEQEVAILKKASAYFARNLT